ncbi:MAG: hypothetical protein PHZ11_06585 [Desulfitobacteriaceae bacterium]|nr:hypothetical protein [Desulfitobacteriaceae bacterium]MDD4401194.1 hypothetical protein [Desulfitobacteriaceae bacterium]
MRSINIPLISLLVQGIPEQIAVVTLAFVIARIPMEVKKIVPFGIILAVTAFVVRSFAIPFGIHTTVLIILLFIALIWVSKGNISLSIIATLLSFLALAVCEFICMSLLMSAFKVTPEILSTNLLVRFIITEPQVLLLFTLAFVLNKIFSKKEIKKDNQSGSLNV